jgi:hypothetical protein
MGKIVFYASILRMTNFLKKRFRIRRIDDSLPSWHGNVFPALEALPLMRTSRSLCGIFIQSFLGQGGEVGIREW